MAKKHVKNNNVYPEYICSSCAREANRNIPIIYWQHLDICGICNSWTSVASVRYYGYPKIKRTWNVKKIIQELLKAKSQYETEGNTYAASVIQQRIDNETK